MKTEVMEMRVVDDHGSHGKTDTRRRSARVQASAPAMIRHASGSLAATLRDVSLGGVFLFTDVPFREGSEIQVVLALPRELGLAASEMVCCAGKIVRVERHGTQFGIAAEIAHIEGLP